MDKKRVLEPVTNVQLVDRNLLKANDYNPNKVTRENLDLLKQSILVNGWTLPIVARPDYTIIDGFHRWMISGEEPLLTLTEGKVPIVIVDHKEESENVLGTITHNRARGVHLLEPMKAVVQKLIDEGLSVKDVGKQLGMSTEEVFRLSNFSKQEFLDMLTKDKEYSKAEYLTKW